MCENVTVNKCQVAKKKKKKKKIYFLQKPGGASNQEIASIRINTVFRIMPIRNGRFVPRKLLKLQLYVGLSGVAREFT